MGPNYNNIISLHYAVFDFCVGIYLLKIYSFLYGNCVNFELDLVLFPKTNLSSDTKVSS